MFKITCLNPNSTWSERFKVTIYHWNEITPIGFFIFDDTLLPPEFALFLLLHVLGNLEWFIILCINTIISKQIFCASSIKSEKTYLVSMPWIKNYGQLLMLWKYALNVIDLVSYFVTFTPHKFVQNLYRYFVIAYVLPHFINWVYFYMIKCHKSGINYYFCGHLGYSRF